MAVPNFLCVGAQKAGTTTLYEILKQHPDIFLPRKIKETKFFVYAETYSKGKSWYEKEFFSEWDGESAVGEIDPAMLFEENSPRRILETLGQEVKLIFIFRNPVARAYSHYLMSVRKGFEDEDFETAIGKEEERLAGDPTKKYNFSYVQRGFYSPQVDRYLHLFRRENLLFLVFEDDFIRNRKTTFEQIQDFLGIKKVDLDLEIRSNEASAPKSKAVSDLTKKKNPLRSVAGILVPSSLRKKIRRAISGKNITPVENARLDPGKQKELIDKYFMDDIHRLEKIIGRDLGSWYK